MKKDEIRVCVRCGVKVRSGWEKCSVCEGIIFKIESVPNVPNDPPIQTKGKNAKSEATPYVDRGYSTTGGTEGGE